MRNFATIAQTEADNDTGFIRAIDCEAARRQFNMSLCLLLVFTLATVAILVPSGFRPAPAAREAWRITVQLPQMVHVQQAETPAQRPPGG